MSISTIVLLIILIVVGIKYILKEDKRLEERAVGFGPVTVMKRLDGNLFVVKLADNTEVAVRLDKPNWLSDKYPNEEQIILHQNLVNKLFDFGLYTWDTVSRANADKELNKEIAKYKRI